MWFRRVSTGRGLRKHSSDEPTSFPKQVTPYETLGPKILRDAGPHLTPVPSLVEEGDDTVRVRRHGDWRNEDGLYGVQTNVRENSVQGEKRRGPWIDVKEDIGFSSSEYG